MNTLETVVSKSLKDLFVPNPSILMAAPPPSGSDAGNLNKLSLLFLDIDGVLNGAHIQAAFGTLPHPDAGNPQNGYVYDAHAADIVAAKLINQLCKSTGSRIVLSSSWRIGFQMDEILVMLETLGIDPSLVLGRTDTLYDSDADGHTRGRQIQRFLANIITVEGRAHLFKYDMIRKDAQFDEKVEVTTFAIVDDDDDMLPEQKGNFVQTDFMDGLKCSQVLKLGVILSNDETFHLNQFVGIPSAGAKGESKLNGGLH